MTGHSLHTIVETPEFRRHAARLLPDDGKNELIDYLGRNPEAGDVIPGTGGARKLRWATSGKGKRGGLRVITFYSGPIVPVFLLTVFGKGERINLTKSERNSLRKLLGELVKEYLEGANIS